MVMQTAVAALESLLAVDVGTTKTDARLFDIIDGRYRFIGSRTVETTIGPPFWDAGEGVRQAIRRLEEFTGRSFFNKDGMLISPSSFDNSGVDSFVITMSAGTPIKTVIVGLVEEVSIESLRHLSETTYSNIVEKISLTDNRTQESRIDAIIKSHPELILIAGGIEGGASASVKKLVETVSLACQFLPGNYQPQILFAGNKDVASEVQKALGSYRGFHIAENIRPTWEFEQLGPAQKQLSEIFRRIHHEQSSSIKVLDGRGKARILPTAAGFERVIRFLSKVYDPGKGVLGIDIGASSTTIVSGFDGKTILGVYPQLGLGRGLPRLLRHTQINEIDKWLPIEIPVEDIQNYLYIKAAYPESLPATLEEMTLEQAITRQVMSLAVKKISGRMVNRSPRHQREILPWLEPILASGSVFSKAPTSGQCMLMVLDGLQPIGVTTILVDDNNMIPSLGVAAEVNPAMVVQVLGSSAIRNLGAVIAPVGRVKEGEPILNLQITYGDGRNSSREVKFGAIETLQLAKKESASIRLQPLNEFDVGMGPGRGGSLKVVGGDLGVVIDGRGRPLNFSTDPGKQRSQMRKWLKKLENR
jgi:hypothetical protein